MPIPDDAVLIDTSAWIDYLRGRDTPFRREARRLILDDRAATVGPVWAELLVGVRSTRDRRRVDRALEGLHRIDADLEDWRAAGMLGAELGNRGLTIPLTELLIATVCRRRNLSLLTSDQHFSVVDDLEVIGLDASATDG